MGPVRPEDVRLYEPGMAAHMMDVLGHDFRCEPVLYLESRPMPHWPERRPLVSAMPMAYFCAQWKKEDEERLSRMLAAEAAGTLTLRDIMESDEYLR